MRFELKSAEYRETWKLSPISARKKIERLRSFFKFCIERKYADENPAKFLKPPRTVFSPTLPVSDEDFNKLLEATERFPKKGIYGERTGERIKAFLLLLRYSGVRITDAVTLKPEHIKDGKFLLRTQKTGVMVWCRYLNS